VLEDLEKYREEKLKKEIARIEEENKKQYEDLIKIEKQVSVYNL
jgi:hypothetical protein